MISRVATKPGAEGEQHLEETPGVITWGSGPGRCTRSRRRRELSEMQEVVFFPLLLGALSGRSSVSPPDLAHSVCSISLCDKVPEGRNCPWGALFKCGTVSIRETCEVGVGYLEKRVPQKPHLIDVHIDCFTSPLGLCSPFKT